MIPLPSLLTHIHTHTLPRRLSMEVDQLLGQIGEPNTYADYDVPRSIYGNRSQQRLRFEERALQGQLDELSNKRDKLANELHGLITQVRDQGREGGKGWEVERSQGREEGGLRWEREVMCRTGASCTRIIVR